VKKFFETGHLVSDLKGRSVRGSVVSIASQGLKLVLQIVQLTVLARLLTPHDYGLWGMALVVTGFLALFHDLGLSMATVQRKEITHEQVSALFWVNGALGLGIALVAFALAPVVAWWNKEPRLVPVVMTMASAFFISGLAVQHLALLRRQMRFGRIALLETAALVAGIAVGIACAAAGLEHWSLVWMQLTNATVAALGAWLLCPWRPGPPHRAGVRSMLGFGANLLGFNVVNYLGKAIDILLLGWRWGKAPVGFFERSTRLMQLPITQINAPVTHVAVPALSRVVDQPERYRQAYLRFADKILLVTMPGVAGLVALSDWLVAVLMGPQWGPAARIFAILGLGALIQPFAATFSWLLISQDRTRELFRLGVLDTVVRAVAVAIALPWGATGVASAVTIRAFLIFPVLCIVTGHRGPVSVRHLVAPLGPPFVAAAAVFATVLSLRGVVDFASPVAGLAACIPAGAAAALAVLVLLPNGRRTLVDLRDSLLQLARIG